jgi:hypothetical protein
VREPPAFLNPHSEHILDWFHVAMRVADRSQLAQHHEAAAIAT